MIAYNIKKKEAIYDISYYSESETTGKASYFVVINNERYDYLSPKEDFLIFKNEEKFNIFIKIKEKENINK